MSQKGVILEQNLIFEFRKNTLKVNQKEFAKYIKENVPYCEVTKQNVADWEKFKYFPNRSIIYFLAGKIGTSERELINNLTRHFKPGEYTLEGVLKSNLTINERQQKIN